MSDFWLLLQSHFLIKPRQLNKGVVVWNTNIYEQTAAHLIIDSKIEMTQDRQLPKQNCPFIQCYNCEAQTRTPG